MGSPENARRNACRPGRRGGGPGAAAVLCLAALLLAPAPAARASQLRPLNLEELASRAGRIVAGRVTAVHTERDAALGLRVTSTTLRVERGLKGAPGETLTFRALGGHPAAATARRPKSGEGRSGGAGSASVRGMPVFRQGERVLVFLYPESAVGLTSPVGFGQGKFTILDGPKGGLLAMNAFGNRGLLRGLSSPAHARIGRRHSGWDGRGPLPLDELLELIEALDGEAGGRDSERGGRSAASAAGKEGSP